MGKRSNFERVPRDFYPTPYEAVIPLLPHLPEEATFAEPCCGTGELIFHLADHWILCNFASDIEDRFEEGGGFIDTLDALELNEEHLTEYGHCDYIITNPPWERSILHPMIEHFRTLRPTWLLFDAGWAYTKQSREMMQYCSDIVAVGRVKWIPDSKMTGKDDCAWYQFQKDKQETRFHGR